MIPGNLSDLIVTGTEPAEQESIRMMQLQEEERDALRQSEGWRQEMPRMFQDRNQGHLQDGD